jgi:hypothetical protein
MAYVDEYGLFAEASNDLHKKVARSVDIAARNVINEDSGTENHKNRLVWAKWIRAEPDRVVAESHRAILHVLDNPTVAAAGNASADNDVQYVVNGLVNELAKGGYR